LTEWNMDRTTDLGWSKPISARAEKEAVAEKLAARLRPDDVVGVGSGSTSYLTLLALGRRAQKESIPFRAIATSVEMERACVALQVPVVSLSVARPNWSFDGADEVAPGGRLIKGRGGAMLREKLVIAASAERYILVDETKMVTRLGEKFRVPVELHPDAVELVFDELSAFGVRTFALRQAQSKDGPVITERGGLIADVAFTGEVPREEVLEALPGVMATGVFDRFAFEIVRTDAPRG
jgi:ribose 5-phosphate isomerase A